MIHKVIIKTYEAFTLRAYSSLYTVHIVHCVEEEGGGGYEWDVGEKGRKTELKGRETRKG